jgi:hypothetical protein
VYHRAATNVSTSVLRCSRRRLHFRRPARDPVLSDHIGQVATVVAIRGIRNELIHVEVILKPSKIWQLFYLSVLT